MEILETLKENVELSIDSVNTVDYRSFKNKIFKYGEVIFQLIYILGAGGIGAIFRTKRTSGQQECEVALKLKLDITERESTL